MEITSIQKFIHTSPRKMRLVADMIRKMEPEKAVETLHFTNKMAAKDLSEAVKTALANAKQKGLSSLYFKSIEVNEGPKMKRFRAGTKGRVKPYKKRMSHIKIVLTDEKVSREEQVPQVPPVEEKQKTRDTRGTHQSRGTSKKETK